MKYKHKGDKRYKNIDRKKRKGEIEIKETQLRANGEEI